MIAEPYGAILVGGPLGVVARITGSVPRRLKKRERARLRQALAIGYSIQIVMPDEATWRRDGPKLLAQLGIGL